MTELLNKLKKEKEDFVSYFNKKFENDKGDELRKENEENEVNCREENNKIQKENKKSRRINMLVSLAFYSTSFIISALLIYLIKLGVEQSVSPKSNLLYFFCLPSVLLAFYIGTAIDLLFGKVYIKEKQYKLHNIEEVKINYSNNLKCSMDEIKHYYSILIECLGEEVLNKKIIELKTNNEDIGDYTLILRIFEKSIQDEEKKIKDDETIEKLRRIIK